MTGVSLPLDLLIATKISMSEGGTLAYEMPVPIWDDKRLVSMEIDDSGVIRIY